jgi:hypothetical protein
MVGQIFGQNLDNAFEGARHAAVISTDQGPNYTQSFSLNPRNTAGANTAVGSVLAAGGGAVPPQRIDGATADFELGQNPRLVANWKFNTGAVQAAAKGLARLDLMQTSQMGRENVTVMPNPSLSGNGFEHG